MSYARKNLLGGTRDWSGSWYNTGAWSADGTHDGFAVMSRTDAWQGLYRLSPKLVAGQTYTFSACVKVEPGQNHPAKIYISNGHVVNDKHLSDSEVIPNMASFDNIADGKWHVISLTFTPKVSKKDVVARIEGIGGYKLSVCAYMLVEGDQPAAWAPAEGETLAGGGALMSANLLDGVKPRLAYGSMIDGVITSSTPKDDWKDVATWPITTGKFAENQTMHLGISAKWHGAAATTGTAWACIKYADASGYTNSVNVKIDGITTEWKRLSLSAVVPSGMHVVDFRISADHIDAAFDATSLVLSYGSPVCLASSAHTPYATQDHVSTVYATKASLKVTDDSIKAEVSARAQTDRNVADLSSRLTQTANSLTSEISDRRSAITTVTGLANAAQSTADAAKSSASSAVSTANSASTSAANAVETANAASSAASSASTAAGKASSDAAAAVKTANSASSTANSAVSTANTAKSTADAAKTSASSAVSTAKTAASDATKAQTMATENQSSIKQLSSSITAEVTARTKTDRMVSEVSSRLTQTADGFSASISKLSETDKKVNAWFDFEADSSGNPQLKMGSSTSPVVGVYTNAGLAYKSQSGDTLLELDASRSATVADHMETQDVKIGKWKWIQTQGGTHLTLVWAG